MFDGLEEPTLPFGFTALDASSLHEERVILNDSLSRRLFERAESCQVSVESLCNLAWALVLARASGRDDATFGTAPAASGNVLPFRIKLKEASIEELLQKTHKLLAEVRENAHPSSLAFLSTISPLCAAVISYRNASDGVTSSNSSIQGEFAENHTAAGYPLSIVVEDLGEVIQLIASSQRPIEPRRVCEYMQAALEQILIALETASDIAAQAIDVMPHRNGTKF